MQAPAEYITSVRESDKIEAVVASVGFDDLLDVTLPENLPHLDNLFVVTSHDDALTVKVCQKYGAIPIRTDLFTEHGKTFAKGSALNAGLCRCQYKGWRLTLDADIVLPDNFRRILINHTHLDQFCLYGADRTDVIGPEAWQARKRPQWGLREEVRVETPIRARVITSRYGYLPLGYFQLWHSTCTHEYPSTAGGAGLDDVVFSQLWPESKRRLLPSVIVYHLCAQAPILAENWDGTRRHPRIDAT